MGNERLAEAILNHALEIICLLTVEEFIVVKRSQDGSRCTFTLRATEINSNICGSPSQCPELLFTLLGMGDKTQEMIAELAGNIVHLLSRQVPEKSEDVAVCLSKDKWEYLGRHEERRENNLDTCATEQQTNPVQLRLEKSYPIKHRIKEEPDEGPYYVTDGTSTKSPSKFIPGSLEKKSPRPIVNVLVPLMEDRTAFVFSSAPSCDIKCEAGEGCSENTMDSVDSESPQFPPSSDKEQIYTIIEHIKKEPDDSKDSYITVSADMINAGGTSTNSPSKFIPGNPEKKSPRPIVNVLVPLVEAKTAFVFGSDSSYDIKCEAGEGCSENTMDSEDAECTYEDEDYIPPKVNRRRTRTRKSMSGDASPPCDVCGKVLKSKSSLERHLQIHTGDRPFPCNECGKRFSCRNHLTSHKRSHSGERPYPCNQCGRRFINHQHLVLHRVVHTGEKPYSCPVCGKGFTRQSSVVKHSGMHAEKKPHVCNECGKSYCQYANLVVHQRLHSGEKPFVCKYCEKAFTCKATMLRHQRAHTGERPFPCPQCDKCFIDNSTLSKHKRRVHAKEPKPA